MANDTGFSPFIGNMQKQSNQALLGEPQKITAFSTAKDAFEQVSKLKARINELVNRLVGVEPQANQACGPMDAPPVCGMLDELSQGARRAMSDIQDAHEALGRLEREL